MVTKSIPTKTTGPLHFEDLEPHRFEDLVRRLLYDFRQWRELEATGRTGSDEGFDARGYEAVQGDFGDGIDGDDDDDDGSGNRTDSDVKDRVWLIQCKREKSIPPKKLAAYLDALPRGQQLYGIIFAAACDFSKAARDAFRTRSQERGFQEAYLWGKGELEDMLYQPKNDDVLFTFFGVSKRIRQRSLSAEVRRKLVVKRKAQRLLQSFGLEVLVRDASDDRYPYADETQREKLRARRWCIYRYEGCHHDGLHVLRHRHLAFIDDDGVAWDFAECMDDSAPHKNPWRSEDDEKLMDQVAAARANAMTIWDALPEKNRAWFEEYLVLPYESVIDIDDKGDEWFEGPHIYVGEFDPVRGPFRDYRRVRLCTIGQWSARHAEANPEARVKKFLRDEALGP